MVKKIIIDCYDYEIDINELIDVLKEVKKIKKKHITLYCDYFNFWYFQKDGKPALIWDKKDKKFKKSKECRMCGTYTLNDDGYCDDCKEIYDFPT